MTMATRLSISDGALFRLSARSSFRLSVA